jgi:alkylation response protein AidB-like acyl-CoA dehydrogenase
MVMAESLKVWAGSEVRDDLIRGIARGDIRLAQGLTEPDAGSDAAASRTTATRDGDEWRIDGTKMFTSHAHNATLAFILARTNRDVPKHKGLTALLVPLDQPGIEVHPVHTLGNERTNMVFFDGARARDAMRLGPVDGGWVVINGVLSDEHGMGVANDVTAQFMYTMHLRAVIEAAIEWATATDTTGRCPIDDPMVCRQIAEAALDLEVALRTPGEMARVVSSDSLIRHASALLDLAGAVGLLRHGSEGSVAGGMLEHRHRSAQATAIYGGSIDIHRNLLAEQYLGLPRHRMVHGPSKNAG